jgi:hypothetical protein
MNFLGTPPTIGANVFLSTSANLKIYYLRLTPGWTSTFGGKPTIAFTLSSNIIKGGGTGKLTTKKRPVYLYIATGTSLSPNINNLKFYDTGRVDPTFGLPIYYDETNTYTIIRRSVGGQFWVIEEISNPGNFLWTRVGLPIPGTYFQAGGASGTVTISAI